MDNSATDDSLAKLTEIVQHNVSVQVIQTATDWGKQFNHWADRLDAKDDSKSDSDQGQGQGSGDKKALMALLHIREQQDEIRERTGALENQKAADKNYNADAQETSKAAARRPVAGAADSRPTRISPSRRRTSAPSRR